MPARADLAATGPAAEPRGDLLGRATALLARAGIDPAVLVPALVLLVSTVAGQALTFAVQILIARTVGPEGFGIYAWVFTWVSLLALVALLGTDRLLTRFVAEYRSREAPARVRAVVAWSIRVTAGLTGLVAAGMLLAAWWLGRPGETAWAIGLLWGAVTLPLMVAGVIVESVLRAAGAQHAATFPSRLLRPALFGLIFVLAIQLLPAAPTASWALAANAAAILLSILVCLPAWRRSIPRVDAAPADPVERRGWWAAGIALCINTLALQLNTQLDLLVLGAFHDHATIGVYGAVARLVTILGLPGIAVIMIVQPMIAASRAGGDPAKLQRLVQGSARLAAATTAAAAVVVLAFAEPLLGLFGEGFAAGAGALRILTLGATFASLISLAGPMLAMTGHQRDATLCMVAGTVLTLLLNLALVPGHGATGAAVATATSTVIWNLALFATAWRRLGVVAAPFGGTVRG